MDPLTALGNVISLHYIHYASSAVLMQPNYSKNMSDNVEYIQIFAEKVSCTSFADLQQFQENDQPR